MKINNFEMMSQNQTQQITIYWPHIKCCLHLVRCQGMLQDLEQAIQFPGPAKFKIHHLLTEREHKKL
jgi:hypothetical protein